MSSFKCKICGGKLEFKEGETIGVCDSCGTKQTLPKLNDNERKTNLLDRANHFFRHHEYDRAMNLYEQILSEDTEDAEIYWSLVLCRYGVEYVEDPDTKRRIPTIHRLQAESLLEDHDYQKAIEKADERSKELYEESGKEIEEIRRQIWSLSQKEEPYDVFICYKETDKEGKRTRDSVLANELYHELKEEGYKVFFSRISLENKLGENYESCIFSALHTSKVMVVIGTKAEYLNSVWVKNEWSRYLELIKQGEKKVLIPAYSEMDPYDLPEEFSHLQAQDMSKLGFMQDLVRGIKKIASEEKEEGKEVKVVQSTTVVEDSNISVEALMKRIEIFLEYEEWKEANEYCEKILDRDPENAQVYLYKLMIEMKCRKIDDLKNLDRPFDNKKNYLKAIRFGDEQFKKKLDRYIEYINDRNEKTRQIKIYKDATKQMQSATTEEDFKTLAEIFKSINDFEDANIKMKECLEKAEIIRKDALYSLAIENQEKDTIASLEGAIEIYSSISEWKDSEDGITICKNRIEELKIEEQLKAEKAQVALKRKKKIIFICTIFIVVMIISSLGLNEIIKNDRYNKAVAMISEGNNIVTGYEELIALGNYRDSAEKAKQVFEEYKIEKFKVAKVGECIYFGSYEQDGYRYADKEDIEWIVLDERDGKLLIISKYALDYKEYALKESTWEQCNLRTWLNKTFLDTAFSEEEQKKIALTLVYNDKNPKYETDPGNATYDKIFLLSETEVRQYFDSISSRKCKATPYCNELRISDDLYCDWWLRTPGYDQEYAIDVDKDGQIDYWGESFRYAFRAVRPALWIIREP